MKLAYALLERDWAPDLLIRRGIRQLLAQRLADEAALARQGGQERLLATLRSSPIAVHTDAANEQHYELPPAFFEHILSAHMKYSCGWWEKGETSLDASDEAMLTLTCERAELSDGQKILELGCGWGSLTLFMAARFPRSTIVGVSNSAPQKAFIETRAKARGLTNIRILTCDMNDFEISERFDRVVSVEMFEHMRNYELLMGKVARFLEPAGKLFVHIFTHREYSYLFDAKDDTDWMSRYFFTGGIMPSENLLHAFTRELRLEKQWNVNGTHYEKTSEAWLKNMDQHRTVIRPILEQTYGADQATKWWVYWRVFFMACAELWGYRNGEEWGVTHYLFQKR